MPFEKGISEELKTKFREKKLHLCWLWTIGQMIVYFAWNLIMHITKILPNPVKQIPIILFEALCIMFMVYVRRKQKYHLVPRVLVLIQLALQVFYFFQSDMLSQEYR